MDFRHEWKHEINRCDLLVLRQQLGAVMLRDPHARDGRYFIRSLYFDNSENKALREKLDGVSRREKFRIRYYNGDFSNMKLEKKSKLASLGNKQAAPLSPEQVQKILDGDTAWMKNSPYPLIRELERKMLCQGLLPRTLVDYTREPYIFRPGNVRVTLDYDIRTSITVRDFLDWNCVTIPAGDAPIILEVKWDQFLPDIIRQIIQLPGRRSSAFSKYAQCRIYD